MSGVVIFLLDAIAQFAYPAVSGPASEAPTSEACEEATRIAARACATSWSWLVAFSRMQSSASGRRTAASPQTWIPTSTFADLVFGPVCLAGATRSSSKSVMVRIGSGSELNIPGISLDISEGGVTPRCLRQGSPLRVLPVIQRRSASLAPMPSTSGGHGVGRGSLRVVSSWLWLITIGYLFEPSRVCWASSLLACVASPAPAASWEAFMGKYDTRLMKLRVVPAHTGSTGRCVSLSMKARMIATSLPALPLSNRCCPRATEELYMSRISAYRSRTPGRTSPSLLEGKSFWDARLQATAIPVARGGRTSAGASVHAYRVLAEASPGRRWIPTACPNSPVVAERQFTTAIAGISHCFRPTNGTSAWALFSALLMLRLCSTALSAMLVPTACLASVEMAACRTVFLECAARVQSTDTSSDWSASCQKMSIAWQSLSPCALPPLTTRLRFPVTRTDSFSSEKAPRRCLARLLISSDPYRSNATAACTSRSVSPESRRISRPRGCPVRYTTSVHALHTGSRACRPSTPLQTSRSTTELEPMALLIRQRSICASAREIAALSTEAEVSFVGLQL